MFRPCHAIEGPQNPTTDGKEAASLHTVKALLRVKLVCPPTRSNANVTPRTCTLHSGGRANKRGQGAGHTVGSKSEPQPDSRR